MIEMWKSIPSLNGGYEASNSGKIRNVKTGRIMKQFKNKHGYWILQTAGRKNQRVHVLVAEAWIGVKLKGYLVHHKDGNKDNNFANNLEYKTYSGNIQHAYDTGLRGHHVPNIKGGKHYRASITEDMVKQIRQIHIETGYGCRKIGKMLGISYGVVDGVLMGKTWKHVS